MASEIFRSFQYMRHGETDWNNQFIFQGQNDVPLNNFGLNQAKTRAQTIIFDDLTEIFTSPLSRAKQTAEIIVEANSRPMKIIEVPEFMECRSEQCGRYIYGLLEKDTMPSFEKVSGNEETPREFLDRVKQGLNFVMKTAKDRKPLIVAHGGVGVAFCLNLDIEFFRMPNCCLMDFEFDGIGYSTFESYCNEASV